MSAIARPAICLNMIVRDEAHIVHELLDAAAPYIATWLIVDTGSGDGTPEVIRGHMARLGIPGDLVERPWRDFGHNRSEAIALARGRADYIWVMDADDLVVGAMPFADLSADVYTLRYGDGFSYWRRQLFRDGPEWRYEGVVHEYATCDAPVTEERLEGAYHIESRRLGGRNRDPAKYARDRDLLLAEVARNPHDARAVFYLAQSCFDLGDFAAARDWYARRAGMGGWDEEVYYARYRVAESLSGLGAPWPEVQDAYLRAWEFRPVRAEPLHALARHCRVEGRYRLGHLFASAAADIPLPARDALFVGADVYAWRALDEQAICAYWIGNHLEAFALCRRLLAGDALPDDERPRVAANRDYSVPALREAAVTYPELLAARLGPGVPDAEVTVTVTSGTDRAALERTLNSFLRCCVDVPRVGRVVVVDTGLAAEDRAAVAARYPFAELAADPGGPCGVRGLVGGRYWLRIAAGWVFFAPERLVGRLTAVLGAEPGAAAVAVNYEDAAVLTGRSAGRDAARRDAEGGRYVTASGLPAGPALIDTARVDRGGGPVGAASLDEVLCVDAGASP